MKNIRVPVYVDHNLSKGFLLEYLLSFIGLYERFESKFSGCETYDIERTWCPTRSIKVNLEENDCLLSIECVSSV